MFLNHIYLIPTFLPFRMQVDVLYGVYDVARFFGFVRLFMRANVVECQRAFKIKHNPYGTISRQKGLLQNKELIFLRL